MRRRQLVGLIAGGVALLPLGWFTAAWIAYPSDRTPEGAYLRIVAAVNRGDPASFFPYVETSAQHACYTVRDYRRQARDRVLAAYPSSQREELARRYEAYALAPDGADVFALYARERRWLDRLRADMSRPASVEQDGERATVVTSRGTRYPFRRRENGIWGLTLFTPALVSEAEKAARDAVMVEKAARDYERANARERK